MGDVHRIRRRNAGGTALISAVIVSTTMLSALTVLLALVLTHPAAAQTAPAGGTQPEPSAATSPQVDPEMQRVAACKAQALAKLKERSPSIEDIYIDVDGLTIAQANAKLGETDVKGVIMGEAYIQRDRSDSANRFLCLTGTDGKVLFTFFTER